MNKNILCQLHSRRCPWGLSTCMAKYKHKVSDTCVHKLTVSIWMKYNVAKTTKRWSVITHTCSQGLGRELAPPLSECSHVHVVQKNLLSMIFNCESFGSSILFLMQPHWTLQITSFHLGGSCCLLNELLSVITARVTKSTVSQGMLSNLMSVSTVHFFLYGCMWSCFHLLIFTFVVV